MLFYNMLDHEILTVTEEAELIKTLKNSSVDSVENKKAYFKLIEHNLRLVAKEAHKFSQSTGCDLQDLISEGYLGLIQAIEKYDPEKSNNARLATYASYWIHQKIRLFLSKNTIAHVPNYLTQGVSKYKKLLFENSENGISREEIKKSMEINEDMLVLIEQANIQSISINFVIKGESTSREVTIGETLKEENIKNPDKHLFDKEKTDLLSDAVSELNERDRDIIRSQYLDDDKITLHELGCKYNLSTERIRQLKQDALNSLRLKLNSSYSHEIA